MGGRDLNTRQFLWQHQKLPLSYKTLDLAIILAV